jgi:hypothetical protein
MSGAAGGAIPIGLIAIPVAGVVLVGAAVIFAASVAVTAAMDYEAGRRARRDERRKQELESRIGSFGQNIRVGIESQFNLNVEASNRMMEALESNKREILNAVSDDTPGTYQNFLRNIDASGRRLNQMMLEAQADCVRTHNASIQSTIREIEAVRTRAENALLNNLPSGEERLAAARGLAQDYINEASTGIEALKNNPENLALCRPERIKNLDLQLGEAKKQYQLGNYQASMAIAKNVDVDALNENLSVIRDMGEWENFHKLALVRSAELKAYLETQSVITPERWEELKQQSGRDLDKELGDQIVQDILGSRIGDYTDAMDSGERKYDYLTRRAGELTKQLETASPVSVSTENLKEILAELNEKLFPDAMTTVFDGLSKMNDAFTRQKLGDDIVNFFVEHNFMYCNAVYDGGQDGESLKIGLRNDSTGDELVITLSSDVTGGCGTKTHINIDQTGGDAPNEERQDYYRLSLEGLALGKEPGEIERMAQSGIGTGRIVCPQETRGKLSTKSEALKQQLEL